MAKGVWALTLSAVTTAVIVAGSLAGCAGSRPIPSAAGETGGLTSSDLQNKRFSGTAEGAGTAVDIGLGASVVTYAVGTSTPTRTITAGIHNVTAVTRDLAGILYVASQTSSDRGVITEYAPGSIATLRTLSPTRGIPVGLNVVGNHLYVFSTYDHGKRGQVTEYVANSTKVVMAFLTGAGKVTIPSAFTVDAFGTIYVGNNCCKTKASYIDEYDAGSTVTRTVTLPLFGNLPLQPEFMRTDAEGILYVAFGSNSILEYAHGTTRLVRTIGIPLSQGGLTYATVDASGSVFAETNDGRLTSYIVQFPPRGTAESHVIKISSAAGYDIPTSLGIGSGGMLLVILGNLDSTQGSTFAMPVCDSGCALWEFPAAANVGTKLAALGTPAPNNGPKVGPIAAF